jgi:hypothetical protein
MGGIGDIFRVYGVSSSMGGIGAIFVCAVYRVQWVASTSQLSFFISLFLV